MTGRGHYTRTTPPTPLLPSPVAWPSARRRTLAAAPHLQLGELGSEVATQAVALLDDRRWYVVRKMLSLLR